MNGVETFASHGFQTFSLTGGKTALPERFVARASLFVGGCQAAGPRQFHPSVVFDYLEGCVFRSRFDVYSISLIGTAFFCSDSIRSAVVRCCDSGLLRLQPHPHRLLVF